LQIGGVQRRGSTERKQFLSAVKQNGGGGLTPSPGTDDDSNGGRTPSEHGGARSQNSDVSEGKKKRERLGTVAEVVCFSGASRGPFYRVERERELGFPVGGRSWVTRLLRARAGVAR
jgi:hypothetical protein